MKKSGPPQQSDPADPTDAPKDQPTAAKADGSSDTDKDPGLFSFVKEGQELQDGTIPAPPPTPPRREALINRSPFGFGLAVTLGGLLAIGIGTLLVSLQSLILIIIVSLFLALGLNPIVEWLMLHKVPRGVSVALVALAGVGLVTLGVTALLPLMTQQIQMLIQSVPQWLNQLNNNPQIANLDAQFGFVEKLQQAVTSDALINSVFGGLLGAGRVVANIVFSVIITLVLTLYFLAILPSIKTTIYQLSPASRRARVRYIADLMFGQVGSYLTGMFIVVTIAASCAFVMMLIVGLGQYAVALAFVVAMFAFIPLVGSSLSMIVVAAVGLSISPTTAVIVIIYFLIYQQFDAYVIQPRVMSRQVSVPGPVVIVAALAGGTLLGIIGALIAIPTAAALLLLYREVVIPTLDAR